MNEEITFDFLNETLNQTFRTDIKFDNKLLQLFSTLPTRKKYITAEVWKNYLLYYPSAALNLSLIFEHLFSRKFEFEEFISVLIGKTSKNSGLSQPSRMHLITLFQQCFTNYAGGPFKGENVRKHLGYVKNRNQIGSRISESGYLTSSDILEGSLQQENFDIRKNPLNTFIYDRYFDDLGLEYLNYSNRIKSFNTIFINTVKNHTRHKLDIQDFGLFLNNDKFEIQSFDNSYSHGGVHLNINSNYRNYHHNNSLKLLEHLIQNDALEKDFQSFFQKHPYFLLSLGNYKELHPHLILKNEDRTIIPDFFLETYDDNYVDICELKRPTDKIVNDINRYPKFRDKIAVAKAQVNSYRDFFDDKNNREYFEKKYGLKGYRPDIILVIGDNSKYKGRMKRTLDLPPYLKIKTYEEILNNARRIIDYRTKYFSNDLKQL